MKSILSLLILLFFNSCGSESGKETPINKTNSMESLITELEVSNCVESKYIGIERIESKTYSVYDSLLRIAPDSLWWNLTYSRSAVARCYAFQTLFAKKYPRLGEVLSRLSIDTDSICYFKDQYKYKATVSSFVMNITKEDTVAK